MGEINYQIVGDKGQKLTFGKQTKVMICRAGLIMEEPAEVKLMMGGNVSLFYNIHLSNIRMKGFPAAMHPKVLLRIPFNFSLQI